MIDLINELINKYHNEYGNIINTVTESKIDNIKEPIKLPQYPVSSNNYYFEIYVSENNYPVIRLPNTGYENNDVMVINAGWNDCADEKWNNGIVFNGDINYCKQQFEYIQSKSLDVFDEMLMEGFNQTTFNYNNEWLAKIFYGYIGYFIYRSLIDAIIANENKVKNKTITRFNYETNINIAKIWRQVIVNIPCIIPSLIHHK